MVPSQFSKVKSCGMTIGGHSTGRIILLDYHTSSVVRYDCSKLEGATTTIHHVLRPVLKRSAQISICIIPRSWRDYYRFEERGSNSRELVYSMIQQLQCRLSLFWYPPKHRPDGVQELHLVFTISRNDGQLKREPWNGCACNAFA